jgi:MFS family permease
VYTGLGVRPDKAVGKTSKRGAFNSTVIALGFTSFFSDISSEMVAAVIPIFLTVQLGFSPAAFGLFQAAYELANALLRMVGGLVADRTRRPKETAAFGYGLSTLTRIGLVGSAIASLPAVPFLLADRLGKGLRTGPRDAMISLATPERAWGTAFGFHRTLDATGALLGPLIAFGILWALPGSYDAVFLLSVGFGMVGFAVIMTWVRNPASVVPHAPTPMLLSMRAHWDNRGFRRILLLGGAFGLFSIGDSFAYLVILEASQETSEIGLSGIGTRWFPLLFAGTAIGFLVTATPFGRLADHVGRARVWVVGQLFLAAVYAVLLFEPTSVFAIVIVLGLLGLYYGATDGVLPALAAGVIPDHLRSGGLALLTTVVAVARMVSALSFGLIWHRIGVDSALSVVLCGLLVCVIVVTVFALFRESPNEVDQ